MEELLPSEVARLVLGFLKENKYEKSWNIFLEECSDLYEYKLLLKKGKFYPTNVNRKSLLDILKEYCILKNASETKSSIAEFFESVYKEKYKVLMEESIQNAMELVIQKYLPCFCKKNSNGCDLLKDATQIDHIRDHDLDNSPVLECETEKMDQPEDTVISEENASKGTPDCYKSSGQSKSIDSDNNSSTQEFISKNPCELDSLDHNLQPVEHSDADRIYMHNVIKVEKDIENCSFLEHRSGDDCSKNEGINSHSQSYDSESIRPLHSTENNSVAIKNFEKIVSTLNNLKDNTIKSCESLQANDSSLGELIQTIKAEPDSSVNCINQTEGSNCSQSNSPLTHVIDNSNSIARTSETPFCSIQSIRGSVNTANPVNLINSQPQYIVNNFASQSIPVSNISYPSLQTYFVQNCPSNSVFLNNNPQYRVIIKTPATGPATTYPLNIPGILSNNTGPTLASVTSLNSQNSPSISLVSNSSSSNTNTNAVVADSTNTCGKSISDSTNSVLNSVCKAAEALIAAPTKPVAVKRNLYTQKSSHKTETASKKRKINCNGIKKKIFN